MRTLWEQLDDNPWFFWVKAAGVVLAITFALHLVGLEVAVTGKQLAQWQFEETWSE